MQLFGQVANLNQASLGQSDWGVVSSVQLRHRYDLGRQDKSAIETQLSAYANRQFQVGTSDVSLLDLTSGPRFQVFNGIYEDVTLKPFATVGVIWVNDTVYYPSYGGGVEETALLSDRLRNISTFVFRKHDNQNTWYLPTNTQYRGMEYSASSTFQFQLSPMVSLFATARRPALRGRAGALAELSGVEPGRRHDLQVPRSRAEDGTAVVDQPVGHRAMVDLRRPRSHGRSHPDALPERHDRQSGIGHPVRRPHDLLA